MVLDLNKCLGCQTCTIACKKLWNRDSGAGYAYWNNVETAARRRAIRRRWEETGGRAGGRQSVRRGEIPDLDRRLRPRLELQPRARRGV